MVRNVLHFLVVVYSKIFKKRKKPVTLNVKTASTYLMGISSGIGDALMAEPLIRTLKKFNTNITFHVIVSPSTCILFEKHPLVQKVFVLNPNFKSILSLCLRLKKIKYDVYIGTIPSNTLSQIFIPFLSGIPFRVKHRTPHRGSRDFDFLFQIIEPLPEDRHRIACNLDLLKSLGIDIEMFDPLPFFYVSDTALASANNNLKKKGYDENKYIVGFHPGCNSNASFKRWLPENYIHLINQLSVNWNVQTLIVGGKDEEEDVKRIESGLVTKTFNFAGQSDLMETAALIKHCRFFVSNDSGIMHLATAVDVPVFAIFGPTNERHIGPYGVKHTVIRRGEAVNDVTVEDVIYTLSQSEYGLKNIAPK